MRRENERSVVIAGRNRVSGDKQAYSAPQLQRFGRVAYLTTGSNGNGADNGSKKQ